MFERKELKTLLSRLGEPRNFIQVIVGPRQVGKTTLIRQLIPKLEIPVFFFSADDIVAADRTWLRGIWEAGRQRLKASSANEGILIIDEIQKINNWSETIKAEWDRDTFDNIELKVVLLGSARLRIQQGLSESLAGRFEVIPMLQWSFKEMEAAFGYSAEQYVWFGGYPGAAIMYQDETRWIDYMKDSILETTLSRDILMLSRVEKPALLRRLLELGSRYSGQILSYTKILGQLQDSGNVATLAHYNELLNTAGLLGSIQNFHQHVARSKASLPKWQVHDPSLLSIQIGNSFRNIRQEPENWGQWVENAVGTHLLHAATKRECQLWYWRDRNQEVDFVIERNGKIIGLEVKSNNTAFTKGMDSFNQLYAPHKMFLIGERGLPWQEFLKIEISDLF
ncbi:ATP-binding protein [Haliscomenobacter sp.]|uniref:ATP-binding protein n=1 Tax=Haliscomenobacter sp. TaxID=2717303 RepID=UPI003364EEA9